MADKDYFDRIADALEIISGDDSHVDDVDKNMDYYKRIAEALENIASNKEEGSGSGFSIGVLIVEAEEDTSTSTTVLKKTGQEIWDAYVAGYSILIRYNYSYTILASVIRMTNDGTSCSVYVASGAQAPIVYSSSLSGSPMHRDE